MKKQLNILVEDDDEMTRDLVSFALRAKAYDVVAVGDGLQAILKIGEYKPDLAILDIMLPDLSGLELLNLFRIEFKMEKMQVILMSRLVSQKMVLAADKLGAIDFLVKPFEMDQLLEKISSLPGFEVNAA